MLNNCDKCEKINVNIIVMENNIYNELEYLMNDGVSKVYVTQETEQLQFYQ